MATHAIAKVQRLEEQLHRVTPEAFYEPCSVLKLEIKEEEEVLATSEDEQHLRDFGGRKKLMANVYVEGLPNQLDCAM